MITIITANSGSDFWTILHKNGKAAIVEFNYGDEKTGADPAETAGKTARFLGEDVCFKTINLEFSEKTSPRSWGLTSPTSGKEYQADCEGDCMNQLLLEEPDAILEMAGQGTIPISVEAILELIGKADTIEVNYTVKDDAQDFSNTEEAIWFNSSPEEDDMGSDALIIETENKTVTFEELADAKYHPDGTIELENGNKIKIFQTKVIKYLPKTGAESKAGCRTEPFAPPCQD